MSAALTPEEADDLFDTLQADIEAASAQEAELDAVLTRLEDLILEDILAGNYEDDHEPASGSVTPSTAAVSLRLYLSNLGRSSLADLINPLRAAYHAVPYRPRHYENREQQVTPAPSEYGVNPIDEVVQESFIQQKSLALLPLLCRFPLFNQNASDRLVKLIVLVSKRLNPKELWLGLDSVVETSRVGLEAYADGLDGDDAQAEDGGEEEEDDDEANNGIVHDSPEHISIYLSRALLAVQIVIPRIRVKKPEKYLKPVLDALTDCFTAIQSPELHSQIIEPELFASTLLLVNTAKVVRDTWAWAQTRQSPSDHALKHSLSRLYLLAIRSLLPLCPEASSIFITSRSTSVSALDNLRSLLLESCTTLDIHPLQDLEHSLTAVRKDDSHASEWSKHVQRTLSHILLAGLALVDGHTTAVQSSLILRMLPSILRLVLDEEIDELLRTVALDAALSLGDTAAQTSVTAKGKERMSANTATEASPVEGIREALEILTTHFDEIADRPPLSPQAPAPARRVIDLCQNLVLCGRVSTKECEELIKQLLNADNPHIRTIGITVLRKLVAGKEQGSHANLVEALLPKFSSYLFEQEILLDDMLEQRTNAWLISLLNFVYLMNSRVNAYEPSETAIDPLQARFLSSLGEKLAGVLLPDEQVLSIGRAENDDMGGTSSQLQLEILKDAWERASGL